MRLPAAGVDAVGSIGATRMFDSFFEAEAPALFRRLCLVTGDRFEAEEVTQEAFVRVLERWDRVGTMDDPPGYLYRTAFNVHRKKLRRAALAFRPVTAPLAPEDAFAVADAKQVVRAALAALTPRQRAALVLTELMGYTSEAAARTLGVKAGTVRALASQGRATLRQALREGR